MKLIWNDEQECFVNETGTGIKYMLSKEEAEDILQAHALGYTPNEIYKEHSFQSHKVKPSTVMNFIKRFEKGEVVFGDKQTTIDEELINLHNRVSLLEDWKDQYKLNWLGKLLFKKE